MTTRRRAIVIVADELVGAFKANLPADTQIVGESYHQSFDRSVTYLQIESDSLPETRSGMPYPFATGIFSRNADGSVVFGGWKIE